ncbi:uncharacterized protein LOC119080104 [Bradysia coprophila]|uniref:uncharacterized protein LOC119080104 n=1 Tax=Bradysia coprophila TaxID=38358 RepID=UPI00187DB190|nr:uncharacterized protein LOC119080104 [Bradysia coprophila]
MGQTSSGQPQLSDCICLCLVDENDENIENWIFCAGCGKWYHRKCNLVNDDGANSLVNGNDWYCPVAKCQKVFSSLNKDVDVGRPVRGRLDRKCKGKVAVSALDFSSEEVVSDRVVCSACGFLAKNARGLKVHMARHKGVSDVVNPSVGVDGFSGSSGKVGSSECLEDFGVLLNRCRLSVPLTRIIQKSVRIAVCQELTAVVERLVKRNDVESWMRLLAFPYIVLNNRSKGKGGINVIRHNLGVFRNCVDVVKALTDVLNDASVPFVVSKVVDRDSVVVKVATRKVGEGDVKGAVRVLCSSESVAPQSIETVTKLKGKHPDDNGEVFEEVKLDSNLQATDVKDVLGAIRSFPLSSSGGIGGLRPRHLKDLVSFTCGDFGNRLLKAIASLTDVIKRGKVQQDVCKIFFGASLTALMKGEDDVRPIAVGIVWRRLAGKVACCNVRDSLVKKLKPVQFGFGVPGGAEALVHAVRRFCTVQHDKPMALVKFDFGNAFNMLFRKFMLGEVRDVCPELLALMQQSYRHFSNLYFLDETLLSRRGFQQGDPLGPPGFCIGIMKMTHSLDARLNGWYLDDGSIGDVLSVVLGDIRKILEFCDLSGLPLNAKKCEVFFVSASEGEAARMYSEISSLLPGIKRVDESSLEMLGSPVFELGLERMFSAKVESIKLMCDRLTLMDVHPALCVFRKSLGSSRFNYLLRSSKAFLLGDRLRAVDEIFRSTLEAIANVKMSDFSWDQASLPLSFGGIGVRKVEDIAMPAYLSSVYSTLELSSEILRKFSFQVIETSVLELIEEIPRDFVPEGDEKKKKQKNWDLPTIKSKFDEMFDSSEPVARARLLASSTKESSKWLQVVPSSQLGLLLDNNSARIAVGLRLGSGLCEEHKCVCGGMVQKDGLHGLSCKMKIKKIAAHDEVNKVFSHAFSSAGFPTMLQPPAFETLGCMGPETKKFIEKLGKIIKATSGEPRSMDYLLQRISIAIQRGNAACILGTLGTDRVDDFYVL